jgi:hypothetical protein
LKILLKLEAGQFDIETAFLYGELDKKLWMELPEGYTKYIQDLTTNGKLNEIPLADGTVLKEVKESIHCLELKKAICGLV